MSVNLKPGISRAKRMVMASRKPIGELVAAQQARVDKLTERIGFLMSQRADAEEILAELISIRGDRL